MNLCRCARQHGVEHHLGLLGQQRLHFYPAHGCIALECQGLRNQRDLLQILRHQFQVLLAHFVVIVHNTHALEAQAGPEVEDFFHFFAIGGADGEEHRAGNTHCIGARERRKERHTLRFSLRQGVQTQRGRRKAKQGKQILVVKQSLGVGAGDLSIIFIVQRHQLDLPPLHATGGIEHGKVSHGTVADVRTKLGVAATQRCRIADRPFVLCTRSA